MYEHNDLIGRQLQVCNSRGEGEGEGEGRGGEERGGEGRGGERLTCLTPIMVSMYLAVSPMGMHVRQRYQLIRL